jgi:plastocyanin
MRFGLVGAFALACGDASNNASPTKDTSPAGKVASVTPTGKVIIIEMITDEKGNYYKPAKIEAHRGDVLRFVLKIGVHNVHFLADSNPGKAGLPAPSDLLQLPGQEWDYTVTLAEGHYVFQCDPHAALGMIGRLEVEDDED